MIKIKSGGGVFALAVAAALLFWVIDALVDYSAHYNESFFALLFLNRREVAFRLLFSACFLIFGFFVARTFAKQKLTEERLVQEIAERNNAEQALREAAREAEEEKTRVEEIMDAIGDGISIQDTDFRVVYQNKAHKKIVGGEYTGELCYKKYAHGDQICKGCPVELSFRNGRPHRQLKSTPRDEGALFIEINASPLTNSAGEIIAGIEVVRDMSVRKRMEEELHKHLAAMDASMDGMAIAGRNGEYIYLNDALAAIYGYDSPLELMGKTWRELYREDEVRRFEREVIPFLWERGAWRGEAVGRRKDGSAFYQELSLAAIEGGGLVSVVRDVSDRKTAEMEREKLIDELRDALSKIKILRGLLPMCAWCKKIRDDKGYWKKVETYITEHSDASFTHGICPDCLKKRDPELYKKIERDPELRKELLKEGHRDKT